MGVLVEGMRYIIMHGAEIQGRCGRETEPQYSVHGHHMPLIRIRASSLAHSHQKGLVKNRAVASRSPVIWIAA